jgi:hypothetical protein
MSLSVLTLFGRRLVTTTTGYLGLAAEAVRKGDIVAIFYGCSFLSSFDLGEDLSNILGNATWMA